MKLSEIFERLINQENLSFADMQQVMRACIDDKLSDAEIGAFLTLMRAKGESIDELTAAAKTMQERIHSIDLGPDLIDMAGTGGDGKHTFNISTASSIVAAAAGAKVAKHGNRSVSSSSGSADLLIEAGFNIELSDEQLKSCLNQNNICFLFAPHFNQATQRVKEVRRQLGIKTLFNLLGPLLNPAHVKKQVIGVFAKDWQESLLQVLVNLGSERVIILHSEDGLDEISISAPTTILEYHQGRQFTWAINPKDFNCYHPNLDNLIVHTASQSLQLIEAVFAGALGAPRDSILLNTAIALYCADLAGDFKSGIEMAAAAIDSGAAKQQFLQFRDFTRNCKHYDN
ncbi:anthranilate phosphoribosyltransferase [Legionella beliardensis]|uniref:Anthranilate phosphoribosyltransferase n=1 Tax=Legionella beliardensis TaxID=91822 RepID=A0A378I0E8_9GAMM|nr:anthranilate phosphoribosyltransferase [Legionella beliardensis]STX28629.1 anthranilate phosphoribosyltransferase [Legionella beliardensis]